MYQADLGISSVALSLVAEQLTTIWKEDHSDWVAIDDWKFIGYHGPFCTFTRPSPCCFSLQKRLLTSTSLALPQF